METKFIVVGIHSGQPFQREFHSSANLSYHLEKLMERGSVGDKLTIEVVKSDLPEPAPYTGNPLSNPYFPEE